MGKTKTFTLKNGAIVDFAIIAKDETCNKFFIVAMVSNKQVGFCDFSFENNFCKIYRIAVTDKNYLSTGVGSVMFEAMENFAIKNNIKGICGLFIPRGYNNVWEMTAKFYKNHNMKSLDYDFNYVDRDEIYKSAQAHSEQFDLPVIINKKAFEKIFEYNYETYDIFSSSHNEQENVSTPTIEM